VVEAVAADPALASMRMPFTETFREAVLVCLLGLLADGG
jgi:hypothetical protein